MTKLSSERHQNMNKIVDSYSPDGLDCIMGWIISCHNEWCYGPENFEYIYGPKLPNEPINCPTCL